MEINGRDLNGKFAPGHKGYKKAGMPEMQRETREKLWAFFSENFDKLPDIFQKLNEREQARVLLSLAEFFHPKQREIILEATIESRQGMDLSLWAEQDLRTLVSLHEKYESHGHS
jgi:hypothetical protein